MEPKTHNKALEFRNAARAEPNVAQIFADSDKG
jgi:hypothetical protein